MSLLVERRLGAQLTLECGSQLLAPVRTVSFSLPPHSSSYLFAEALKVAVLRRQWVEIQAGSWAVLHDKLQVNSYKTLNARTGCAASPCTRSTSARARSYNRCFSSSAGSQLRAVAGGVATLCR